MKLKPLYLLAFSLFNFCCQAQATAPASQIIYQYNFSGSASTSVLGQAPDVRPSNEVFVSNDTLSQSDTIKADGAVTGDTRPSYYLPFRVAAGRKNIVSMDVQLNPGNPAGEHWYGLCFARGATLPVADGGLASAYGAMFLLRENGQAQFLSWGTQAGSESRTLSATSGRMEIVLDNTNPANTDLWVVEFRINGGLVFSTQYNGGNFNPDSSDPIQWVGFGKWGPTQGKMDNFTVQVTPAVASVVGVDSTTLTGKVMCGYQGWFTAPITGDSRWIHWGGFRAGDDHASPDGTNLLTDMYPDMREFDADELIPTAMTIGSAGAAAPLYSGSNPKTVRRHVRWMQEYGIDGVFAQRFIHEHMGGDTSYKQQLNKTLWSIKNGCQEYGRVFAVMYDISGPADDDAWVTALKNDWMALVDQGITTGGRYLQQNGKPLVAIWGPGFTDRVPANPATALALINWFKAEAPAKYRASVMGGVPGQWRTLNGDSRTGTAWGDVYRAYDVISPWTVGRYSNNTLIDTWKTSRVVPDIAAAVAAGRAYGTVVWPGFSWKNLNNGTLNQIPRNGGAFYWRQIYNACAAGTTFIYVAMFDEVNEGTAITKVAENASQAPNEGFWVNLDADGTALPSDWYLRLTYEAGRMLRGAATLTATLPTAPGPQTLTGPGLSNTWDGGGGGNDEWSNPANWVGDVAPDFNLPLTFASAYVGAANSAYQFSDQAPTIKGLNFLPSAGAFTLLGYPIVLDGDIANQSTRIQTISLNMDLGSGTRTIAATAGDILLSGSNIGTAQIRKTGDYRLTLSAWNRHTGGTEVVAGTLTFSGMQGEEGNIAGNLTIRPGATVYLNDGWSLGYSGDSTRSVTSITIQGGSLVVGANNTGGTSAQTITMTGGSISQLGDRDFDWYLGNGGVSANPTLRTLASSVPAVVEGNIALRLGAQGNLTLDVALGGSGGADLLVSGAIKTPQILIQDTFAGRGGGNLMDGGRQTPTYSSPGATWERMNISGDTIFTTSSFGDPADSAWGAGQSSGGISLGASVPSLVEIKASIGMSQLGSGTIGSAQNGRGLGLGFFSVAGGGGFSQARFTGLVLDSAGRLNFAHDPNEGGFFGAGSILGTAVAYGGTFVAANYYDLSYTINTATGAISNISLEGSSADYSSLAAGVNKFTAANVKYAGVYTSSEGGMGGYTSFDNFTVSANEVGGVIKNGSGKVIFAGANTYSGNTSVNAGTVELAANGIQQFKILGDGVNNTINGAGTVNLLGSLAFDLAGAGNGYPNTWTIVATGGTRTYGAEFNVLGFSNMGDGTWRRSINDRIYEFSQATGQLRTTEFGATDSLYTYLRTAMTSDGYIVSSTDLLQTSLSSTASTGDFTREACAGLPALIDGEFGPAGTSTGAQADSATCQVGEIITYTLNTSTNLRGYNISKIVSHTGWDQNRFGQRYDVEVHKVGAPAGAFVPLVSVDYRPSSSGTSSAEVTVTGLSGFSGFNTGTLASGVDQIRFIFKNGSNYGHSMYRELDVIGTPTSLGGLGLSFTGGGFELPYLGAGNFQQGTAATGWTSIKKNVGTTVDYGGGILSNGSPYGNPPAPQGEQVALLKGPGGIEQVIAGFEVGKTYTISFKAIGRSTFGDANPFQVLLDGQLLSFSGLTTIQPPKTEYTPYAGTFTARNSTMTLAFLSTLTDGVVDFSSYVDDVHIQDVPNAPVITSQGGILTGTVGDPFSYAITVTPDPATYPTTYQLTGALPAGLTLNSTTGVISGTPTLAEDRSVLVTATNTGGTSTALSLQIQITGGAIDPYDQWLALYPGLSNTSGSADPDQDGWTNHQEYLFGGNPMVASTGILTATRFGSQILFTFVARRTGATYTIGSSTTLAVGSWLADAEAQASITDAVDQTGVFNPTDYVRRQFSVVPATKKFYKVEGSTVAP